MIHHILYSTYYRAQHLKQEQDTIYSDLDPLVSVVDKVIDTVDTRLIQCPAGKKIGIYINISCYIECTIYDIITCNVVTK